MYRCWPQFVNILVHVVVAMSALWPLKPFNALYVGAEGRQWPMTPGSSQVYIVAFATGVHILHIGHLLMLAVFRSMSAVL